MSAIPASSLARVSNLLQSNVALSSMTQTQQQLLDVENEISTGKQVNNPSDNPGAAAIIQQLQKTLDQRQGFSTNLQQANSGLSEVDSTLGNLTDLLQQAQSIASQNVGTDATADQRSSAAAVVQTLIDQALNIGNTQFEGSYLFGGDKSNTAPFVNQNGNVTFVGSDTVLSNAVDENSSMQIQINGAQVFGALSAAASGTALDPGVTAGTRLIDLNGATQSGIQPGSIQITDGASTKVIDLTHADSVGDVVTAINNAGVGGVTASLGTNGINLTGGTNIVVSEVGGGTTAADLGILTPSGGAGATEDGQNVNAKVTDLTPLAALRNGAGIDLSGLTFSNGATSTHVSFTGLSTVQDVINAIDQSNAGVKAQINSAGTGIDIVNPTQGTTMSVSENGGTTASELGVQTMSPSTPLSSLNGGNGVGTVSGADFQITRKDGTTFSVDIGGAKTVQDVINDINTADGGAGISASFNSQTNGISLTDFTGGSGAISVTPLNASTAATDLGLLNGTTFNSTYTGSDVNPVESTGVFADLQGLVKALQGNNSDAITAAAQSLQTDYNRVSVARGVNGAQLKEVQTRQTQIADETTATQSFLSDLQDTDFTTAITKFQDLQTALQANYETAAKVMNMSLINFLS